MLTILSTILFLACTSTESSNSSSNGPDVKVEQADPNQFSPEPSDEASKPTSRIKGTVIQRHAKLGKEPVDTIALWLEAAIRAQNGEKEGFDALGELTIPLKDAKGWQSHGSNTYFVKAIREKNPSFLSFIVGANPENNYKVDLSNIRIAIAYEGPRDARGRKFMVETTGSSMPRPIYLQQSTISNLYYVKEYSSMYVDVKAPADPKKEKFH